MPSIELICVQQESKIEIENYSFTVEVSDKLESHRYPSRFQNVFSKMQGCIYHLGSPCFKNINQNGAFTAYELIDKDFPTSEEDILKFLDIYIKDLKLLFSELLMASKNRNVIFTSDYQFGPDNDTYGGEMTLNYFWQQHDQNKLKLNGIYYINEDTAN